MHAIIRRYEATDKMRTTEIVKKAQDRPPSPNERDAGLQRLLPDRGR
jgi:hypothetical protein